MIKTIRTYDKKNIILVGTPVWSQDVDVAADSPIKGYSNLMYTFHFYAATHKEMYREKVKAAVKKGLPVLSVSLAFRKVPEMAVLTKKKRIPGYSF
ncbi:hypothetical protein DW049_03755 [Ruminococcus sp. AF41-9]|nr:hypothetical protein DW049_03755 [Ruminococcus sp. AF41-9]